MSTATEQVRALVSARLSVLTDDTTSPESQALNGEKKARELGATKIFYTEDLDVSAFKVSPWNRPGLGAWLRRPEDLDMIIVRAIDRLCRNLGDLIKIIEWGAENDVRIVFLQQDLDLSSPYGRFTAYILGAVAQLEPELTQSRMKDAREYMLSVARWPAGRPLYGYRTTPHASGKGLSLEPDDEWFTEHGSDSPATIVREIAERLIRGESRSAIAQDFNRRGIPSPTAYLKLKRGEEVSLETVWYGSTIHDIVMGSDGHGYAVRALVTRAVGWKKLEGKRNPMARGRKIPTKWVVELDDDGIPLRYAAEPLLSDAKWAQVKASVEASKMTPVVERVDSAPLVGILKCAECGHNMYRTARKRKDGSTRNHYQCMSRRLKNTGCSGSSAEENEARDFVHTTWIAEMRDKPMFILRETVAVNYEVEIAEAEKTLDRLFNELESGAYDNNPAALDRFRNRQNAIAKRIEDLKALPTQDDERSLTPAGYTYGEMYEQIYGEEYDISNASFEPLRRRRVAFYVSGKSADGPFASRVTWNSDEWDTTIKPARVETFTSWEDLKAQLPQREHIDLDELLDAPSGLTDA